MLTDNSKYKKQHNEVISYVREQIGIDLNQYRDGDGTDPSTTTYLVRKYRRYGYSS